MATETAVNLGEQVAAACAAAGLVMVETAPGQDFSGGATVRYTIARAQDLTKTLLVELSAALDLDQPRLLGEMKTFLAETARRLRNPLPDAYLSLTGLPLRFEAFAWPFHHSTSGADTALVHGQIRLLSAAGENPLHAKISASMTVTFAEIMPAMEQPFAESVIFNAVRKTLDQGQLELVKSGNRQPVPVTTRYYSMKQQRFVFNDTTPEQRRAFLAAKVFWLSGVLGGSSPVWALDPRDAQYLNVSVAELTQDLKSVAAEGLVHIGDDQEFALPTTKLMGMSEQFETEVGKALAFIKPTFNEDMRGGLTNM